MATETRGTGKRREARPSWRRNARASALALGVALAFPGAGIAQVPVAAPEPDRSGGTLDGLLRSFQLKAKPSTAPDFVEKTRPAATEFIPVGRQHPEWSVKPMTAAEVEAATEALDKARVSQQRRAGVKPPAVPLKATVDGARARKTRDR